jgi:hypothetical protein
MLATALTPVLVLAPLSLAGECDVPINEDCDGAILFDNDDLPYSFSGMLGCENDMVDRPYFDVFFQFDCTVTGEYVFDMCDSTGDTYMRIYIDGCGFGPASSWVEDDDGCGFAPILDPLITIEMEAGRSYWIELGAWRVDDFFPPNANDPYEFHVEEVVPPCPSDCAKPGDGVVDVQDLLALLAQWGAPGDCDPSGGAVGINALLDLLASWGPC